MSRKMRFSKLEMKFVEFSFLVSEYEICISLFIIFQVNFDPLIFFRDHLDIAQKFPDDGRASHNKISRLSGIFNCIM